MIRLLILSILACMSSITLAQSFPKVAVIESDTVAILTIPQIKKINLMYVDLQLKNEMVSEMNKQTLLYKSSIQSLESQNMLLLQTKTELNKEVDSYRSMYEVTDKARIKAERSEKKFKILGFTIAVAGIAVLLFK